MNKKIFSKDITIVLSGEAGQGIQTVELLALKIAKLSGYHVFSYSEFMSRIRGGNNSSLLRISSNRVDSFVEKIDILIPLNQDATKRFNDRISPETIIIGELDFIEEKYKSEMSNIITLPFEKIADEIGGKKYINIIVLGFLSSLINFDKYILIEQVKNKFKKLNNEEIEKNINAAYKGFDLMLDNKLSNNISVSIRPSEEVKEEPLLYGYESVGIGALAGGCNFISSYPMSPSTGVLVFLAGNAEEFDIVVEQTEDEISAVNMAIGSWYAGGRAMVTTSGGGFALMAESISLAGCIESPLVIHLAQRPGPATGLPTRTEQSDLNFALYSGHGEFPRVILAPGDYSDGIKLTCHAFNIADKYQIPVIILTDQYFLDSRYNIPKNIINGLKEEKFIIETESEYKRYALTEDGISERGVPGYGEGIVSVDSDEHDESGFITEDFDLRIKMVNKRLKKYDAIKNGIIPPKLYGSKDYRYLIVGWGSTSGAIREAIDIIKRDDIAFLAFVQVYPIHENVLEYLQKAEKRIIIENNATSQFGNLVKLHTGVDFDEKILKYNGMPFSVEELVKALNKIINKKN